MTAMKTFPIPSAPAPSGGEDKPKPTPSASYADGGSVAKPGGYAPVIRPTMNQGYAKGGPMKACSYAEGGSVLGRTRDFVKNEPDQFRGNKKSSTPGTGLGPVATKDIPQDYKGGKGPHKDKSLKTVKPRG